jgi:hypothetical protein
MPDMDTFHLEYKRIVQVGPSMGLFLQAHAFEFCSWQQMMQIQQIVQVAFRSNYGG